MKKLQLKFNFFLRSLLFALTLCLTAVSSSAQAPTWSRGLQELPINYDECMNRAERAFQAEGYTIETKGGGYIAGNKANHSAVIMCNDWQAGKSWVNIVVMSNIPKRDGNIPGAERVRLQQRMEQSTVSSGGIIQKLSGAAGFCLNLHNNSSSDGAVINLWNCNRQPSQQWRILSDGTIRHGAFPDKCLNLHNHEKKDGAVINLWNCNNHASQQWRVNSDMTIRQAAYPNMCLNLHYNALNDGATVNLWSCNNHESQKWNVVKE